MTNGIKVVKATASANSNVREDDILYTSEHLSPKIYKKIVDTIKTDSSGSATFFVDHAIGYPPATLLYMNPTISLVNGPTFGSFPMNSWGLADSSFVFASSTISNIRIDIQGAIANKTYNYVLFILVEAAQNG